MQSVRIPLLDLRAQHERLRPDLMAAFERVLASSQFILGQEVQRFEEEVAAVIGARHAVGLSSGTDALLAALMAIDLQPGDEVITTAYSFFATAGCVVRLGGRPVFVDIHPHTLNLDVDQVSSRVTPRTKALIPVHLFGLPCDLEPLMDLSRARGLVVIEDACQAIGATYRGQNVGTIGDMATFSFFPSKNLGGFGDGGLLSTNDDALASKVRMLRAHGSRRKYHHEILGGNFRLDALQAALLRVKLPYLGEWIAARQQRAARYRALFAAAAVPGLSLPEDLPDRTHVYHQFVVRTERRDALRLALTERGIGTEVYYPGPLHQQPCFDRFGFAAERLPHAEAACRTALALPMFPELSVDQQSAVVGAIREFAASAVI